jgi:hypothetical protein
MGNKMKYIYLLYFSLSIYTFSSTDPVELILFNALMNDNKANLFWSTATETNNYGFEVERCQKLDSGYSEWEKIGFVLGHGYSFVLQEYIFEDKTYITGYSYKYRLKIIAYDGTFVYSNEITLGTTISNEIELKQNFPNPFNPSTTIRFSLSSSEFANLTVYNIIGEKVAVLVNRYLEAGTYQLLFDGSKLASGMYIYKLEIGNNVVTKKMLLTK